MLVIQRPKIESINEEEENRQKFSVSPLEPGFGHTLGNSLRRTLLSSIPGAAITQVNFDDAIHEFDVIEGVYEDVTDILALPLLGLVLEDEQVIVSTNRGEPLTLSGGKSPAARCYTNIARRLQGEEIPMIDPSKEGTGIKDKFKRLMQTKIF